MERNVGACPPVWTAVLKAQEMRRDVIGATRARRQTDSIAATTSVAQRLACFGRVWSDGENAVHSLLGRVLHVPRRPPSQDSRH